MANPKPAPAPPTQAKYDAYRDRKNKARRPVESIGKAELKELGGGDEATPS